MYYLGLEAEKYRPVEEVPLLAEFRVNKGFDDCDGYLRIAADDHINYRYQIQSYHGMGSFSQIFNCHDHKTGDAVALKVYRNNSESKGAGLYEYDMLVEVE